MQDTENAGGTRGLERIPDKFVVWPVFARVIAVDVAHHVTQRGNARRFILDCDADREVYLNLLREDVGLRGVSLVGYCLMSNHVHLVAIPRQSEDLSLALRHTAEEWEAYLTLGESCSLFRTSGVLRLDLGSHTSRSKTIASLACHVGDGAAAAESPSGATMACGGSGAGIGGSTGTGSTSTGDPGTRSGTCVVTITGTSGSTTVTCTVNVAVESVRPRRMQATRC